MSERMHMNNFELTVEGTGGEALRHAVAIVLLAHHSAVAFKVSSNTLVLYWARSEDDGATPFLSGRTSAETIVADIREWLDTLPDHAWPQAPDMDGSVSKGWRIEAREQGWSYEFATVRPVWALHGK